MQGLIVKTLKNLFPFVKFNFLDNPTSHLFDHVKKDSERFVRIPKIHVAVTYLKYGQVR